MKPMSYFALAISTIFISTLGLRISANAQEESKYPKLDLGVRYSVELPDNLINGNSISWEQEQEYFASQLSRAFNIPIEKARVFSPIIVMANINSNLSEIDIASIIMTESTFNENAISSVGAFGATQIRPEYWEEFCQNYSLDMFSLEGNVICSAKILSYLMDKFCKDDLNCALEHYNVGRGNLLASKKYRKAGMRYVKKIKNYSNMLNEASLNKDVALIN